MTVEELQESILRKIHAHSPYEIEHMRGDLVCLAGMARAEGAEQIKQQIRNESQMCDLLVKESVGRDESGNEVRDSHIEKVYAVFPSVLAPKEKP